MPSSESGGGTSRHSVWRTCGQVYGKLALDSGLPGAEAFVEGGGVRRLLWAGALLTLLYYSTSETLAILSEYFTYSVAVAFEYNTNESFELPDVTVCNVNPLRRSKLCALDSSERGMSSELETRICGKGQALQEANPDDLRLQQQISDWIAHHKAKNREWLRTLGHQFADTFVDCTYHEQGCRDATLFRNITNVLYGNCFCFLCDHDQRVDYSALSSPYDGLVVTLNPQLNEYLPTSYQAGFIAMVHAHGTRFSVCQDGVYLSPGYTTYVGLNLLAQTGLPEPYANPCRSTWPPRLLVHMDRMYGVYTREDVAGPVNENGPPARLVLYFNSLTYEHVRSVPKYDETHVMGNLGGIIGMYLGLSFFVIFQVLDILVVGTLRLKKMLR
ncbi:hypothetical protein HPB52_011007 [Rhipicephalus sanguineus]|uniref:Uncharacterized protein n=1 Tax=Rhipicephalus sanguineus TaxID=34632 RepID=A0A9D4T268_RHISA|nr:hypothetical protein HPB52_011007 [Rhipicephalus sanguineus]